MRAFAVASEIIRRQAPTAWDCITCRRRFASGRGLFQHIRITGHGAASPRGPRSGS